MNEFVRNLLIGCGLAFVICMVLSYLINSRKKPETGADEKPDVSPEPEFTTVAVDATVTDMACWVETVGMKLPKTVKKFQIVFETEEGETLKLDVEEEIYHALEKGQRGTLTLVDGELYGFQLTEE